MREHNNITCSVVKQNELELANIGFEAKSIERKNMLGILVFKLFVPVDLTDLYTVSAKCCIKKFPIH